MSTIDLEKLFNQREEDVGQPFSVDGGGGGGPVDISDVTGLQAALDLKAALASPALTGTPTAPTQTQGNNSTRLATTAYVDAALAGTSGAAFVLSYDTTGSADAGAALQSLYDAGARTIIIPPGLFKANTPVFFDGEDGMQTVRLIADGVTFIPGAGLPTVAEFNTFTTNQSQPSSCQFFLFPSTYRAALSGGVVTTVGHNVLGTASHGATKSGIHPHLVVDGGCWCAIDLSDCNAGFIHTNTGGAVELRGVHLNNARTLLATGSNYIDGNKMYNCSGWANNVTAGRDLVMFYQYGSGDGVEIHGVKTADQIMIAKMYSCNGATITSSIGGGFYFKTCHGIHIAANHTETAPNISNAPRIVYNVVDSHVTIDTSFDYLSATSTDGALYVFDTGDEGKHSTIVMRNYFGRQFLDPNTSDPSGGYAIYLKKFNDRSRIDVYSSWCQVSASDATFGQSYGIMGLPISGDGTNEPTLAAAVAAGRDYIGSGTFSIYKSQTSTMSTGQNQAMNLTIGQPGNVGRLYVSKTHVTPTSYDSEQYGATGTLTNGQSYAYAFAICNTLPDGTIQYGQATAERLLTASTKLVIITELYMPTAAGAGATLVMWRKTGTGVLSAPDRYVVMPVGHGGSTRLFDTGANINKLPWITSSVPVPNTVAGSNHTADGLYVAGTSVTIP